MENIKKLNIESQEDYNAEMKRVDVLMRKGEEMSDEDAAELRTMALAAQAYEKMQFGLKQQRNSTNN